MEAPSIALRLFLLAAQIADECGFEDLTYDFYVQAFTVYEDSISESRAQLQAITLVIGTLAGAKVFGVDNYDTLITKAALHGAKLLKKSHQATAVGLASHLWWQEAPSPAEGEADSTQKEKPEKPPAKAEESEDTVKAVRGIHSLSYALTDDQPQCSIPTKIANVFWNVYRNPSVLPTRPLKRLLPSSYTVIPSINTSITSTMVLLR